MSLKNQIEEKLNKALKEKDKSTYPTMRLIVSAIKMLKLPIGLKKKRHFGQ